MKKKIISLILFSIANLNAMSPEVPKNKSSLLLTVVEKEISKTATFNENNTFVPNELAIANRCHLPNEEWSTPEPYAYFYVLVESETKYPNIQGTNAYDIIHKMDSSVFSTLKPNQIGKLPEIPKLKIFFLKKIKENYEN